MKPIPQTKELYQECDPSLLTEIALVNPGIALLETNPSIRVALARNVVRDKSSIQLQGARLIAIPLGKRLSIIQFLARFFGVRLPDEFEYHEIQIESWCGKATGDDSFICNVPDPTLVLPLTGSEYFQLLGCKGRELHRWVGEHFGVGTGLKANLPRINQQRKAA